MDRPLDNPGLFLNIVATLAAASLGALVAVRLGQSVILGYVFAGIAIGPYTPGFVADAQTVDLLANVGVILLLFAVGLQFSLKDLRRVGMIAMIGGLLQVVGVIGIGYMVGIALGWGVLEALFFGAVISNSSSTVLGKILGERGEAETEHGRIGMAWSAVQDLSTIVLVVVLTAFAVDTDAVGLDLLVATGQAIVFLVLLLPLGSRALPWVFDRIAALRNREVFLLAVSVVALGTAYISTWFGLSLALGAFVAGVAVGESDLSHQILGQVTPLRDIFAGLFFVSIGMFIDPGFVVGNVPLVLITLGLIVLGKGVLTALIGLAFGRRLRTALLVGVSLAQSAEFSFILARLGVTLGAVTQPVFNVMVGGAAASMLVSPWLHQLAVPAVALAERRTAGSKSARLPKSAQGEEPEQRGHVVICGYGRVGRVIGQTLQRRRLSFVAIDEDQRIVRNLREQGVPALLGNAANPHLLERANVARARLLVVALPDPLAAREIVDYAREMNPHLHMVVRTHGQVEREYFRARGIEATVMGELELALEMTRHALHRSGISSPEIQAIINGLRQNPPGE